MAAVVPTLDTGLQLESQHAHIAARLALYDPDLRLRKSAAAFRRREGCGWILERKSREQRPAQANDPDYKIAARDGYVIISPVHISLLMRPEAIVERLYEGDMARQTTGERMQAITNAQHDAKQARKKSRLQDFRSFYAESYDFLERVGDKHSHAERTRINNAGVESFTVNDRRRVKLDDIEPSAAGESPAQESSCPTTASSAAS